MFAETNFRSHPNLGGAPQKPELLRSLMWSCSSRPQGTHTSLYIHTYSLLELWFDWYPSLFLVRPFPNKRSVLHGELNAIRVKLVSRKWSRTSGTSRLVGCRWLWPNASKRHIWRWDRDEGHSFKPRAYLNTQTHTLHGLYGLVS